MRFQRLSHSFMITDRNGRYLRNISQIDFKTKEKAIEFLEKYCLENSKKKEDFLIKKIEAIKQLGEE